MKVIFAILFNFIFVNIAFATTPVAVKSSFVNEIGTLKVHPTINDGYSTKVNYLAGNTFNSTILDKYDGTNIPIINTIDNRISITPTGEYDRQCVAFIKGVTNAKSTSSWRRGSAISILT